MAAKAGELVLYWMHHAVRAEENLALDVAMSAARALDLPLLVYQGLGARHPYDSDRHHTFILGGAQLAEHCFAQAFEFRRAHGERLLHRASLPWPHTHVDVRPYESALGFAPVDLTQADLPALCAVCEVDHAVGPSPDGRATTPPN